MDLNILRELYNALLGFEMIEDDFLKWASQWLSMMYMLAMLTKLLRHFSFFTTTFRCFYEIQSGLGVNKLFHLSITLLNFSWEKSVQIIVVFEGILFKASELIQQSWAKLSIWCKACHKSSILMQGLLLNWRALVAGNLQFLTQFIRSQGLWSFEAVFWILSLKKSLLVFLTIPLNDF